MNQTDESCCHLEETSIFTHKRDLYFPKETYNNLKETSIPRTDRLLLLPSRRKLESSKRDMHAGKLPHYRSGIITSAKERLRRHLKETYESSKRDPCSPYTYRQPVSFSIRNYHKRKRETHKTSKRDV